MDTVLAFTVWYQPEDLHSKSHQREAFRGLPITEALVTRSDVTWRRTGVFIPHGNSKATAGIACHMFLLSIGEGHKEKRQIALCLGDIKHVGLCN